MLTHYLKLFRTVWLCGRPGGGKTSLSIALALSLVSSRNANKICSNTPLGLGRLVDTIDAKAAQGLTNVVTILDESWMHLGPEVEKSDRDPWLAYRRHHNQYLILPSVLPLARGLDVFMVEREFNATVFGFPLWIYQWVCQTSQLKTRKKRKPEQGRYFWWFPQRVFGYYDHKHNPGDEYFVYEF